MAPRYNIAPTEDLDFVANDKGGNLELLQAAGGWCRSGQRNCPRSPTVDRTLAFRDAFKSRRCLIPAAKALLLDNHLDSQLQLHLVGLDVSHSRYEG